MGNDFFSLFLESLAILVPPHPVSLWFTDIQIPSSLEASVCFLRNPNLHPSYLLARQGVSAVAQRTQSRARHHLASQSRLNCAEKACQFQDKRTESRKQKRQKKMLKFLSKVKLEFNALDVRSATCVELLAQCSSRKAKESNPACQLVVKRRTDNQPPHITVTFVNGVEESFNAASASAQSIRSSILEKGQYLETEQMFRDAGETWPVLIPEEEIQQPSPGIKPRKAEEKKQ